MRQGEYHFAYLALWIFIRFCCVFFTTFTDILYLSAVSSAAGSSVSVFGPFFFAPPLLFLLRSLNRYVTVEVWKSLINHSQAQHPGEQAACRKTCGYYLFIPNGRCTRVTFGYGTVRCEQAGWTSRWKPRDSRQNRFLRDARCQHRADLRVNINI